MQFQRTSNRRFHFNVDARVSVLAPVPAEFVANALGEYVAIGKPALLFVADASIEVVLMPGFAPERNVSFRKEIVCQLCDRAVNFTYHRTKQFARFTIAQDVIVIVQKRCYPRREQVFPRIVLKPLPEDLFSLLQCESVKSLPASSSDEIHLIVAIPVLEASAPLVRLARR